MCYGCWQRYDAPKIVNEKTLHAAALVGKVYDHHLSGGHLHILVDDFNIEDHHLAFCALYLYESRNNPDEDKGTMDVDKELMDVEHKCLKLFLEMTIEERASALAIHDGYFEVGQCDKSE